MEPRPNTNDFGLSKWHGSEHSVLERFVVELPLTKIKKPWVSPTLLDKRMAIIGLGPWWPPIGSTLPMPRSLREREREREVVSVHRIALGSETWLKEWRFVCNESCEGGSNAGYYDHSSKKPISTSLGILMISKIFKAIVENPRICY